MDVNRTKSLLEEISALKAAELIPVDIFIGLLTVFGLSGNIFVILFYSRKLTNSPTSLLIFVVAINDAVVCVLMPKNILLLIYPYQFKYTYLCKTNVYINHITSYISVTVLLIIAIFRYRGICKPFAPAFTVKHANGSIVATCIFSFIVSTPTFVLYEALPLNITIETNCTFQGYDCQFNNEESLQTVWMLSNVVDSASFVISTLCFIVVYWRVGMAIAAHKKTRKYLMEDSKTDDSSVGGSFKDVLKKKVYSPSGSFKDKGKNEVGSLKETAKEEISSVSGLCKDAPRKDILGHCSNSDKSEREGSFKSMLHKTQPGILSKSAIQQTPMLIAITVIHVASFLPYIVISVQRSLSKETVDELTVFYQFGLRSYLINSATNPYVYLFFNRSFRKFVKRILCSFRCTRGRFTFTNN